MTLDDNQMCSSPCADTDLRLRETITVDGDFSGDNQPSLIWIHNNGWGWKTCIEQMIKTVTNMNESQFENFLIKSSINFIF